MYCCATFRLDRQWSRLRQKHCATQQVNMDNLLLLCHQQDTCMTPPSPTRATSASCWNWEQLLRVRIRLADTQQTLLTVCQGKAQTDRDLDSRAVAKTPICTWTEACQFFSPWEKESHHTQNSNVSPKEVNSLLTKLPMFVSLPEQLGHLIKQCACSL